MCAGVVLTRILTKFKFACFICCQLISSLTLQTCTDISRTVRCAVFRNARTWYQIIPFSADSTLTRWWIILDTWSLIKTNSIHDIIRLETKLTCSVFFNNLTIISNTHWLITYNIISEVIVTVSWTVVHLVRFAIIGITQIPLYK